MFWYSNLGIIIGKRCEREKLQNISFLCDKQDVIFKKSFIFF